MLGCMITILQLLTADALICRTVWLKTLHNFQNIRTHSTWGKKYVKPVCLIISEFLKYNNKFDFGQDYILDGLLISDRNYVNRHKFNTIQHTQWNSGKKSWQTNEKRNSA